MTSINENANEILEAAKKIMSNNIVATLSTSNQNICHSNNIYYAFNDKPELVFVSDKDTIHAENIRKNSNVSVVIYNEPSLYGQNHQGIQISGTCVQSSGLDLISGFALYIKRFPLFSSLVKSARMIEEKMVKSRLYTIKIKTIKVLDIPSFGPGFRSIEF